MKMTKKELVGFNRIIWTMETITKGLRKPKTKEWADKQLNLLKSARAKLQVDDLSCGVVTEEEYAAFEFAEITVNGYIKIAGITQEKDELVESLSAFHHLKNKILKSVKQGKLPIDGL